MGTGKNCLLWELIISLSSLFPPVLGAAPVITNLPGSVTISENTNTVVSLYNITLTDAGTCSLDHTEFQTQSVSAIEWEVSTIDNAYLDYYFDHPISVTVTCSNPDGTTSGTLTVNLLQNQPPVLENLPNSTRFLDVTSSTTLLYTLNITDVDSDANSVLCGFAAKSRTEMNNFRVAETRVAGSWDIEVLNGASFDASVQSEFVLEIWCADDKSQTTGYYTVYIDATTTTTTVTTTTNFTTTAPLPTQDYKNSTVRRKFFANSTNLLWFISAGVALLALLVVVMWVCFRYSHRWTRSKTSPRCMKHVVHLTPSHQRYQHKSSPRPPRQIALVEMYS